MSRKNALSKMFGAAVVMVCMSGLVVGASAQTGLRPGRAQAATTTAIDFPTLTIGQPQMVEIPRIFRVDVPQAGILSVWTVGDQIDTMGEIVDLTGKSLASDDDGGQGTNTRVQALTRTGTYLVFIRVFGNSDGGMVEIHSSLEH